MAQSGAGGHVEGFLQTWRRDNWWIGPVLTVAGLGGFGVYLLMAIWQASYYVAGPYLSPLYSPLFFVDPAAPGSADVAHAWFGTVPTWWPSFLPKSPAFLVVWMPTAFRGTCYYYRKAYYRAFFGLPPGCAVGPMKYGRYEGETGLLIFQNLHRYAMYIAVLLVPLLLWEALRGFYWEGHGVGVGLGGIIMLFNVLWLSLYTFGCHSWRHLIGGRTNCFSCDGTAHLQGQAWSRASWLNARHMQFAWISLFWFWGTELYIRLVSMGMIPDINTWEGISWSAAAGGSF